MQELPLRPTHLSGAPRLLGNQSLRFGEAGAAMTLTCVFQSTIQERVIALRTIP